MDLSFRRYVIVHGYFLGVAALVVAPLTVVFRLGLDQNVPSLWMLGFYTHCEWIGAGAWVVCALWLLVGTSFLYGMVKRRKRALQPLLILLGIHLLLVLVGELLYYFESLSYVWSFSEFMNASTVANMIYVLFHVALTEVLLGKLFDETSDWEEVNNAVYGRTISSVMADGS